MLLVPAVLPSRERCLYARIPIILSVLPPPLCGACCKEEVMRLPQRLHGGEGV